MAKKNPFQGGLNLKIFDPEFESLNGDNSESDAQIIARNVLRLIMMGWSSSWTELFSWSVFNAIFIQRDLQLIKALRLAFQQGFEHLFTQLSALELSEEQEEQVQLYLSNFIGLLPYSDLTPYESIKIPQLINKRWELVEYYVTPIELTSPEKVFKDQDRVFAYGLQPIVHPEAQRHLIFKGTTYPAGQGFIPQVDTDFKVFNNVGSELYYSGKSRLFQWISQKKDRVHVCGVSLGGALSLLFALDHGEFIDRVDVLNPPGLAYPPSKNRLDPKKPKPKVVIQCQAGDPISSLGVWDKEWEIVEVTPPDDKRGPNAFCDHVLNYAGFAQTQFSYVSTEEENSKRKYRNFLFFSLGRGLVYYGAIWPYNVLVRPTAYFLYSFLSKKSILFSVGLALCALVLLNCLGMAPLFLWAGVLVTGLLSYGLVSWVLKKMNVEDASFKGNKLGTAEIHDPKLPRNPTLNIYNQDNSIDIKLTHDQINTYYRVMRCLVKGKEFVPQENKPYKHKKDITKRELLLMNPNPDESMELQMPKAKVIIIKRVLDLVNKIGVENQEQLKKAVENEYNQYRLGK